MLEKRNKKFLIIITLLFFVCFFIIQYSEFIKKENISIIILECALLFIKKEKYGHFGAAFYYFCFTYHIQNYL